MISKKKYLADGSARRFLSDFIIRSEQFTRPYAYIYDDTLPAGGGGDALQYPSLPWGFPTNLYRRGGDAPTSEDLTTVDTWQVVDNSILYYDTPLANTTIWVEVATTSEEFGDTLTQPTVERAETAAAAALVSETNASASEVSAAADAVATAADRVQTGLDVTTSGTNASNASTSAAAALVSENAAATSETNASASATAAATSETNASASETSALASKNAATISETNAAASEFDYKSSYLREQATAPSVDLNGNAITTGDLFFDTTLNVMRVYDGVGWQTAGSTVNGTSVRQTFIATEGQTTFTLTQGYDANFADVYLNGTKLVNSDDVDVTSGTDIVLTLGATAGDIVDVVAYGVFIIADTVDLSSAQTVSGVKTFNSSPIIPDAINSDEAIAFGQFTGYVLSFATSTVPTGFLECNGTTISRTTYAELFAVIGTVYGVGDGSTTFTIPDLRGEFIRGFDNSRGIDSGRAIGSYQAGANEAHKHTGGINIYDNISNGYGAVDIGNTAYPADWVGGTVNSYRAWTDTVGGSEARPRNIAMMYCIKY